MACVFSVSSLIPTMSSGQISAIDVQGTVQFSGSSHCIDLDVSITCGPVVVLHATNVPITFTLSSSGTWAHHFATVPAAMNNCCGKNVTVSIKCQGCPPQTLPVLLDCEQKCPTLGSIICNHEPCLFDGTVLLNFNAQVISLGANPSVTLQWMFDNNNVGPNFVLTSTGWVPYHDTVPGDGQTHQLTLKVLSPTGCPPLVKSVTLPECGAACPPIQFSDTPGACNPDGTRNVTYTAVLTGTPTTHISATMTGPCGPVTQTGTGSLTMTSGPCALQPGTYTITVTPGNCPPQTYTFPVADCYGCPKIDLPLVVIGECKDDGTRPVTITAVLTGTSPNAPITATMTTPCGPVNDSGVGTLTLGPTSCTLHPGTYTGTVTVPGCPPKPYTFKVEDCCPDIKIKYDVGECNKDGTRPVTITAVLTAASSTTLISAQMTGPCGTVNGSGAGSVTLTSSCSLNTGSYPVTVTAVGCNKPKTDTITIEDCCPQVDFHDVVKGWPICNAQGTRPVKVWATVTPHSGVNTTATLIDTASGSVMDSGSGSTPFTLTGTGNYPGGTNQVQVSFAAPLNCPPQVYSFCVPQCETLKCFNLRSVIELLLAISIAITVMNALAALAIILDPTFTLWFLFGRYKDYLGTPPQSALTIIQIVTWTVAFYLFIWWWLCIRIKFLNIQIGACCATCCTLRLILWQVPFIVGLTLLWFLASDWLLHLIFALLLFLIAYLFFLWWKPKCCPGKCDVKFYIACAVTIAAAQSFALIDFAGVSAASVNTPNISSWYVMTYGSLGAVYIYVFKVITYILRLIILLWAFFAWIAWGLCMNEPD